MYIVPAFRITMLEKEMTLNKVLHNSGLNDTIIQRQI